jgi:hypothetical protein
MASQTQSGTQLNTQRLAVAHDAVIRVYDESDNVIETHEHAGDFREWQRGKNKKPSHGVRDG